MDIRRVVLYAMLALVSYYLWTDWQIEHPALTKPTAAIQVKPANGQLLPPIVEHASTAASQSVTEDRPSVNQQSKLIHVKTDVLDLAIDLNQGDIVDARLLDYPESINDKDKPFALLQNKDGERYVANSNLFVVNGQNIQNADGQYTTAQDDYQMPEGQKKWVVTLSGKNKDGLLINKEFIFNEHSYLINVRYAIKNEGASAWKGYMNTQLLRTSPQEDKSSLFHLGSYIGASYSEPGVHRYLKVPFSEMLKTNLNVDAQGGWIAMQQHYFLSAWVPDEHSKNKLYTRAADGDYTIGAVSQAIHIEPGQEGEINSRLYVGPEITSDLQAIAPGLDLTVDYGWLWFISIVLFSVMKSINAVVGNWGWSIVLVTVLIKLVFYRLSATSYKSMASMRKLQPKLAALKERYGEDKAKISQATMELYKQEKVNPLGGCLPILIQIPVFMALYWVLLESVELRQAPFIFWIKDLALPDPMHILPVIMGLTMLIQQRLNPAPPDPTQAKVMMFLPILFTGLFWNFPSGLVLYWIVNNSLSILQQWYITRKYSDDKPTQLAVAK